jgi:hypothetical protein
MDMMLVLGIIAAVFLVSLTLIALYHDSINTRVFNAIFLVVDAIFYFIWNLGMYEQGWLDDGFETLGNISPMIFTVIPLTCFMNKRTKDYAYSAISLLWVGMFLALFISPEQVYLTSYRTEATILYTGEALCHMWAALFGLYLILTEQVKLSFGTWVRAIVFMYAVIGFGVFLNYFFHKSHFGMNPYGSYAIYFLDIFGTFEATLVAYLLGVMTVLSIGWGCGYLFKRMIAPKAERMVLPHLDEEEKEIEPLTFTGMTSVYINNQEDKQ